MRNEYETHNNAWLDWFRAGGDERDRLRRRDELLRLFPLLSEGFPARGLSPLS